MMTMTKTKTTIEDTKPSGKLTSMTYQWEVTSDFGQLCKQTDHVQSPSFTEPTTGTKWSLTLYPNGKEDQFRDYVSIYLSLKSGGVARAMWSFALGNPGFLYESDFDEFTNESFGCGDFISIDKLVAEEKNLLPGGKMIITCVISVDWYRPDPERICFDYCWTVDKLLELAEARRSFSDPSGETKWRLIVYPNGQEPEDQGYVSLNLEMLSSPVEMLKTMIYLGVVDSLGNCHYGQWMEHNFTTSPMLKNNRLVSRDQLQENGNTQLLDGKVTLYAEFNLIRGDGQASNVLECTQSERPDVSYKPQPVANQDCKKKCGISMANLRKFDALLQAKKTKTTVSKKDQDDSVRKVQSSPI